MRWSGHRILEHVLKTIGFDVVDDAQHNFVVPPLERIDPANAARRARGGRREGRRGREREREREREGER